MIGFLGGFLLGAVVGAVTIIVVAVIKINRDLDQPDEGYELSRAIRLAHVPLHLCRLRPRRITV